MADEDNCKVPLKQYLPAREKKISKKYRHLIISAGLLLIVSVAILISITFLTLHQINKLKKEVEDLQFAVKELQREDRFYDNLDVPEDINDINIPDLEYDIYDDEDDDDDDDDDEDEGEDFSADTNILLTGHQFTKDFKNFQGTNREKRNVVGYTSDGVPINSESYAEAIRKNLSEPPQVIYRRSGRRHHRVTDNPKSSRQVVKKSSLKSGDYRNSQEDSETEFTIIHTERPRTVESLEPRYNHHPRLGRMRPLPAAHYDGDTSKYDPNLHPHYNGNGHLRHPHGTYTDWIESSWVSSLGMDKHFTMEKGVVTIKDPGIYFIYAQIYHLDEHDTSGFKINKNDELLIQCTATAHSVRRELKGNTCYTAAASYLQKDDRISLKDLSVSHYSIFAPGMSFFGLIKLGDVQANK